MLDPSVETGGVCLVSQVTAADSRAIEGGLNELWQMAAAGEIGGSIVRAASLTLVVPVPDDATANELVPLLDELTATHPFRAIFLVQAESLSAPRTRLASHMRRGGQDGEGAPYWEEIRLQAPSSALRQTISALTSLALPNLPVECWWPGSFAVDDQRYAQLTEVSDRVIVDSTRLDDATAALSGLATAIASSQDTVGFSDLSWTRLTPLRTAIAELFDAPGDQAMLDSIERVTVEYVRGEPGAAVQAMLVVGWLASRLGWEPQQYLSEGRGAWRLNMVDGVRTVHVAILRAAAGKRSGRGICSVTIEAFEDNRESRYRVEANEDDLLASSETDGEVSERRSFLPAQSLTDVVREELGGFATDRIYFESIQLMARALGQP
ncbi:MAG: glucose-6-phosphate dehydrogenase assembly protein OpcA [Chloroflexota bacterium]